MVVLNSIARSVVDSLRSLYPDSVFTDQNGKGKRNRLARMNNEAWRMARERADLPMGRVHDLRHTSGRRLRAAGVSLEDRQDLLGYKSNRISFW